MVLRVVEWYIVIYVKCLLNMIYDRNMDPFGRVFGDWLHVFARNEEKEEIEYYDDHCDIDLIKLSTVLWYISIYTTYILSLKEDRNTVLFSLVGGL